MGIKSTKYIERVGFTDMVVRDIEAGKMSNELGATLQQLSYNVLHGPEVFFEKGDAELLQEFESRVMLYVCERWTQFDVSGERGDAFSYFTKMIANAWRAQFKSLGWKDYLGQNNKTYVYEDGKRQLKRSISINYDEMFNNQNNN